VTELVRGQISDRPWGLTFGQLGLRELTGQLTVHAEDGRDYRVAFQHGAVVGASSPQPVDAASRIAMTSGLLSSSQVATVAKQIAATPEIDEIALLASAARLQPEQIAALRRRVIGQRAARTFSVEAGWFVVDDTITIPVAPDAAVDVRAVVLQGARLNLSEQRLVSELRSLGSHFTLGETALAHATWFGLEAPEMPILDELRTGTTVPEIEARHREIDPRTVQAVIYALVACRECQISEPPVIQPVRARSLSAEPVSVSFTRRSGEHAIPASLSASPGAGSLPVSRTSTGKGAMTATPTPPPAAPLATRANTAAEEFRAAAGTPTHRSPVRKAYADDSTPITPRTATPSVAPPARTAAPSEPPRTTTAPSEPPRTTTSPSVAPRTSTPSQPPRTTTSPSVAPRTTTPSVAPPRTVTPLPDEPAKKRQTTAPWPQVKTPPPTREKAPSAPPVITPRTISQSGVVTTGVPAPRTISQSGGMAIPRTLSPGYSEGSDRVSQAIDEAAEAYKRGLEALRANQLPLAVEQLTRATTLNPHEFEHAALLAFAQLLSAAPGERTKLADKTRKMLTRVSQKSRDPIQALVYLAQLEHVLGNDKQAVVHYRAAIAADPAHAQAIAELQQLEDKALEKSGFGLFKKK